MKTTFKILPLLLLSSCATTTSLDFVTLKEGNYLYKTVEDKVAPEGREFDVILYKSKQRSKVEIDLNNTKLELKPNNLKDDFEKFESIKTKTDLTNGTKDKLRILDAYTYHKEFIVEDTVTYGVKQKIKKDTLGLIKFINVINDEQRVPQSIKDLDFSLINEQAELEKDNDFKTSVPLKYNDNKWILQTLSIPFKLRRKVGNTPSTVSTNFNAGIAYGHQWNIIETLPIYDANGLMVGYEQEKLSFALAPFAGLTTVALTADNTEPDITTNQTVMGFSFGAAGVFSFNRLNLGLALGIDHGFGKAEDWVYQDKLWTGIVIGLDLIK